MNEEDSIKNEGARVFTTLYIDFQMPKGSLLRNLWWDLAVIQTHPSFHACMSSLPVRMKIILKMKALECSQDFFHSKSMGIFPDAQGQLTLQSMVGSGRISNSSETLWLSSLPAKMKKIHSKM